MDVLLQGHGSIGRGLVPLLLSPSAKFFRSELVRLSAGAADVSPSSLLDWAVSAELIHAASLIHDDIVDESGLRRQEPTLHITKGSGWAVLAGDLLLSEALQLMEKHGTPAIHAATMAVSALTKAAIEEIELRPLNHLNRPQISSASFGETRKIAAGKTGALFGYCLAGGPILLDDSNRADQQFKAGVHLGVAYQFRDDLIDLIGEPGKPRGTDLREGNPNAFLALVGAEGGIPPQVIQSVARQNWENAADALLALPHRAMLLARIQTEVDQAKSLLGLLAREPQLSLLFDILRKDPSNV